MRMITLADWTGFQGSTDFEIPLGIQRVLLDIITEGVSVFVESDGNAQIVGFGSGRMQVEAAIPAGSRLVFVGKTPDSYTSVLVPWFRDATIKRGWVNSDPFVQLDLKAADEVSPQVRAVMNQMQYNMTVLRAQLEQLRQEKNSGA